MAGFQDMLTEVAAGSAIESSSYFIVDNSLPTSGANAAYALLDEEGVVWASGVADSLSVEPSSSTENKFSVSATITIPETIEVDSLKAKYQIRWLLQLSDSSQHSSIEYITILPQIAGEIGAVDTVELINRPIQLQAVLPSNDNVSLEVYSENTQVYAAATVFYQSESSEGWNFEHSIVGNSKLVARLEPYTVVWSYRIGDFGLQVRDSQAGRLFVINPSMLNAVRELNTYLNRLNRRARLEELSFSTADLVLFLKGGADMFNGYDYYTDFTFTNAQKSFRHWWLVCSQIVALRTRYLEEGESSFDFSGQAVQLSVDITQYIEAQASNLENLRDQQLGPFKRQLHKRGILEGDASEVSFVARTRGVSGITTGPVSSIGRFGSQYKWK